MSSMNAFRLIGDGLHVIAILILLFRLLWTKSCAGISARSQIIFALVYTTRYLDLGYTSCLYNFSMKIMYLVCSYVIVLLIIWVYSKTYQQNEDIFLTEFLIVPCSVMAVYFNYEFTALEILWAFSIYLEAVAILPQFYMIYKKKRMARSLFYYLLALGTYRAFYVFSWIYRYYVESYYDLVADGAGVLYTFLYVVGVAEILFNGIKITDGEGGTLLKSNIFFISNNGPLEDRLNLMHEQQDIEKNNTVNQPELEKV